MHKTWMMDFVNWALGATCLLFTLSPPKGHYTVLERIMKKTRGQEITEESVFNWRNELSGKEAECVGTCMIGRICVWGTCAHIIFSFSVKKG